MGISSTAFQQKKVLMIQINHYVPFIAFPTNLNNTIVHINTTKPYIINNNNIVMVQYEKIYNFIYVFVLLNDIIVIIYDFVIFICTIILFKLVENAINDT